MILITNKDRQTPSGFPYTYGRTRIDVENESFFHFIKFEIRYIFDRITVKPLQNGHPAIICYMFFEGFYETGLG
jgi:hypothetical protein